MAFLLGGYLKTLAVYVPTWKRSRPKHCILSAAALAHDNVYCVGLCIEVIVVLACVRVCV